MSLFLWCYGLWGSSISWSASSEGKDGCPLRPPHLNVLHFGAARVTPDGWTDDSGPRDGRCQWILRKNPDISRKPSICYWNILESEKHILNIPKSYLEKSETPSSVLDCWRIALYRSCAIQATTNYLTTIKPAPTCSAWLTRFATHGLSADAAGSGSGWGLGREANCL